MLHKNIYLDQHLDHDNVVTSALKLVVFYYSEDLDFGSGLEKVQTFIHSTIREVVADGTVSMNPQGVDQMLLSCWMLG